LKGDTPIIIKFEINDKISKQNVAARNSAIIVDGSVLSII
jgi:hypothetical protein